MTPSTLARPNEETNDTSRPPIRIVTRRSFVVAVAVGLGLALLSIAIHHEEFVGSEWHCPAPTTFDGYRSVWGWPLVVGFDDPCDGLVGRFEPSTELQLRPLILNWMFFTLAWLYARGLRAVLRRREIQPQPILVAALPPVSVFVVGQVGWSLIFLVQRGELDIFEGAWMSMLAGAIALGAMFVIGIPVARSLQKVGWWRSWIVGLIGAFLGLIPGLALSSGFEGQGPAVLGAATGAACALSYWLLTRRVPRRAYGKKAATPRG